MYSSISPAELYALRQQGRPIDLIDVRTAAEFAFIHAEGARCIPFDALTPEGASANRLATSTDPIYLICHSGGRSASACEKLSAAGLHAVNVTGGTSAWQRAGLPVVALVSRSTSLAFQIVAAIVLIAGLVLAIKVDRFFIVMSVGAWLALVITGRAKGTRPQKHK